MVNKYKFEISIIASIVLLGLSIYIYNNLKFDYNLRQFFPTRSTETTFYYQFLKTFDAQVDENAMVIAIQSNSGIFNRSFLTRLDSLSKFLIAQNYVSKVYSITSLNRIYFINNEFNARPLIQIDRPDLYEQDSLYIFASPEYYKHFLSKNRKACAITVIFKTKLLSTEFTEFINSLMHEINRKNIVNAHVISAQLIEQTYVQEIRQEAVRFFIISLFLITLCWIFVFRSIKKLLIPLLVILISLVILLSIMVYMRQSINILSSLLPIILATTCLTGIIHMFSINTAFDAPLISKKRFYFGFSDVDKAVFYSALTSAIGFVTLLFSDIQPFQIFGLYTGVGIIFVFGISLLFVKIIVPEIQKVTPQTTYEIQFPFFNTCYSYIFKFSRKIIGSSLIILIVSIYFITKIQINGSFLNELPSNHQISKDVQFFEREFGGCRSFEIVLSTKLKDKHFYELSLLKKVDTFIKFLEDSCKLQSIRSPISLIKATNKAYLGGNPKDYEFPKEQTQLNIYLQNLMQTEYAEDLRRYLTEDGQQLRISGTSVDLPLSEIHTLEKKITEFTSQMPFSAQQTGAGYLMDLIPRSLIDNILPSLLFALFILSILIWSYFKMIWLVPIAMIPNLFPLILLAGFMGATGIYLKADTAILFSIVFGLSVDYTIHFLNKFKTERSKSNNLDEALRVSFVLIAKPLTINTLILLSGFLSLLISDFKGSYTMGLLLSLSMVLAWLCNLILFPILIKSYFNHFNDNRNQ